MKRDECIEFINSVDFIIFSTDVLHEAGQLHASVNQVYDEEKGLAYQYHLELAVNFAKAGFPLMPWLTIEDMKIIPVAVAANCIPVIILKDNIYATILTNPFSSKYSSN